MPSAAFPNSVTYHVAEQGLSRLYFAAGAVVPLPPGSGSPPPPVTTIPPLPATPPNPSSFDEPPPPPQADPVVVADWDEPAPLAVEVQAPPAPSEPPVALKRPHKKKHRRQTLLPA